MKQQKLFFILYAALLMVSCGTSTSLQRHRSDPDAIQYYATPQHPGTPPADLDTPPALPTVDGPARNEAWTVDTRVDPVAPLTVRSGGDSPAGIGYALNTLLASQDTLLQRTQLGLHVVDLTTAEVLFARNAHQRMRPASTEKVATAVAALDLLGPNYSIATQLLSAAGISGSTLDGDLYLKAVMDPLLSLADVRSLANQLRDVGIRTIEGRLIADTSFKDAEEFGWGWCWDDDNPTLSPLLCEGKPILVDQLIAALRSVGITVARGTSIGRVPAGVRPLATVSRPLTAVLQPMLKESDNLCAEAVFYHVGKAYAIYSRLSESTKSYSRKNASSAVAAVINKSYLPVWGGREGTSTVADGSGLSLYNYQTPAAFTCLLAYATTRPEAILNPLMAALPIASVDGTLKNRMSGTAAAANVRAKTGTVTAISSLVGYTTQRSTGHLIAFAIMNQGVERAAEGRALQDKICALLSE